MSGVNFPVFHKVVNIKADKVTRFMPAPIFI